MSREANRARQDKKALKILKRQAKKPPSDINESIKLGDQLVAVREWSSAINCFRCALKIDDRNVTALNKLAYALACAGLLKKSIQAYKSALSIQPKNHELLNSLGAICNAVGEPQKALE